jgi:DNA-binding NarL/FixJ family response regulator
VITERTVMRHVEHLLAKPGVRSRTQIAVRVVEHGAA